MKILNALLNQTQTHEKRFKISLEEKARYLLGLAQFTVDNALFLDKIERPLLNQLYIFSYEAEEFMDYAGALSNNYWYNFRRSVAVVKGVSQICNALLHIKDSYATYQLLEVEGNFKEETQKLIKMVREFLISSCGSLLDEANKQNIEISREHIPENVHDKVEFNLHLLSNKRVKHEEKPDSVVVVLATEFLHLSGNSELFDCAYYKNEKKPLMSFIPNPISAENLRKIETQFHNLQSLYDTHVSHSDLSQQDKNLPIMRGHISVIYHLMEVACLIVHFYQRHLQMVSPKLFFLKALNSESDQLVNDLVYYTLSYADRYRKASRDLCQAMLKQYAKMGEVKVNTPNYRGFHVRPSTLISRIVLHYGSDVKMMLYGEEYNAAVPLDMFRANEELNAHKRKNLYDLLGKTKTLKSTRHHDLTFDELKALARDLFLELADKKQIVIYDPFFAFTEMHEEENDDAVTFVKRAVTYYLAVGKFDTNIDTPVTFVGDQRVLEDIKILAENGYGEDRYGNNILLPRALDYLRQPTCVV